MKIYEGKIRKQRKGRKIHEENVNHKDKEEKMGGVVWNQQRNSKAMKVDKEHKSIVDYNQDEENKVIWNDHRCMNLQVEVRHPLKHLRLLLAQIRRYISVISGEHGFVLSEVASISKAHSILCKIKCNF